MRATKAAASLALPILLLVSAGCRNDYNAPDDPCSLTPGVPVTVCTIDEEGVPLRA